jgi:hypothetical protein
MPPTITSNPQTVTRDDRSAGAAHWVRKSAAVRTAGANRHGQIAVRTDDEVVARAQIQLIRVAGSFGRGPRHYVMAGERHHVDGRRRPGRPVRRRCAFARRGVAVEHAASWQGAGCRSAATPGADSSNSDSERCSHRSPSPHTDMIAPLPPLSPGTVGGLERGERNVSLKALERYAERLGVEPTELLTGR